MLINDDGNVSPYEEHIGYSDSLKKKDANCLKECILNELNDEQLNERNEDGQNPNSESKKSHTFGRRTRLAGEGDANSPDGKNHIRVESDYLQQELLDKNSAENQKKLLYDKQLKAYYDPESGQYFQMKPQLMSTSAKK